MLVGHPQSVLAGRLRVPRNRAVFTVSDLKQRRRDQVPPAERPCSAIFSKISLDPALEELLQDPPAAKFRILTK